MNPLVLLGCVPTAVFASLTLFGDTSPGDAAAATGGIAGFGSLGISGYLIWRNSSDIRELRTAHEREMTAARAEFTEKYALLSAQFLDEVREFRKEIREARSEQQRNVERYLEHSRELIVTLEKLNQSQKDLHAGQIAMKDAMQAIEYRMQSIEKGQTPARAIDPAHQHPQPPPPPPGSPPRRR